MHIPRNITTAQKRAQDFHKSDALAQTNQIKYDCFFLHSTENIRKLFSQDLKLETWKYNTRRNVNSDISIVTMRRVAIIFFELGV